MVFWLFYGLVCVWFVCGVCSVCCILVCYAYCFLCLVWLSGFFLGVFFLGLCLVLLSVLVEFLFCLRFIVYVSACGPIATIVWESLFIWLFCSVSVCFLP